jgi:hypothetical protein
MNEIKDDVMDLSKSICYTYEVKMVIQILAPNKDVADAKLERDGGYISKREVNFVRSTVLYEDIED